MQMSIKIEGVFNQIKLCVCAFQKFFRNETILSAGSKSCRFIVFDKNTFAITRTKDVLMKTGIPSD